VSKASRSAAEEDINRLGKGAEVYKGPVLFLAGECNTWIGKDLQESHARMYAHAGLAVISDAGHDMFWDNAEESLAVVRDFLQE